MIKPEQVTEHFKQLEPDMHKQLAPGELEQFQSEVAQALAQSTNKGKGR